MFVNVVNILKSEIFWVAGQSIFALVGLLILFKYTQYTKRMMELQLETRRAEIAPVFTLSSLSGSANASMKSQTTDERSLPQRNIHMRVRNIGKGPALRFTGWHGPISPTFQLDKSKMLARRSVDQHGVSTSFEVLANEPAEMVFQLVESKHWLCVLECEDTGGYKHQFQLILIPEPAAIDPWVMVHGWSA